MMRQFAPECWVCWVCGYQVIGAKAPQTCRKCGPIEDDGRPLDERTELFQVTGDPLAAITKSEHGAARLARCLAANCKLLHQVHGRATCVGRGQRCTWLAEWTQFLAGDEDCPHWAGLASQHHQQDRQDDQ